MALSQYERTANRFRRSLLRDEAATRKRLALAYADTRRVIAARLARMPEDATFRRLRLQELQRQIEREIAGLTDASAAMIANGQRTMTRLGPAQAAGLVTAQAPELSASFTQLPRQAFAGMVGSLQDGTPLTGVLSHYGQIAASEAATALQNAIAIGTGPRETGRQLRRILGTMQWEAERISRTEMLRVHRESSRQTYLQNQDIVTGYRRLSARDGRVCPVCIALDGTTYRADEVMPVHPNDRCTMLPIVRGYENVVPFGETGPQWFDRQNESVQRQILGRGKFDLFQSGIITLEDIVAIIEDPTWGPTVYEIPLRQLVERGRRAA